jgi:hypothetical protein
VKNRFLKICAFSNVQLLYRYGEVAGAGKAGNAIAGQAKKKSAQAKNTVGRCALTTVKYS